MLGGGLIENLKPILNEFKRWRVLLDVLYGVQNTERERCFRSQRIV
jgi:hypothetical protein